MLSGLTSQLGTLIGSKNKEPAPPAAGDSSVIAGGENAQQNEQKQSPTQSQENAGTNPPASGPGVTDQAASVLSSVRSHIPAWLGGNKVVGENSSPIPTKEDNATTQLVSSSAAPGDISPDKESDASSATGGADSDKAEEGEAGTGLGKVKNLGNFLFSTIKGAGQKIKETNILGEFQREHDSFLKSKSGKAEAIAPWIGHPKEEALKEEILSLSSDRRNFVRSPPSGVSFTWDWDEMAPVARAILKEDPHLEEMRYQLVPKVITEEHFWRNYFYRVSLLKESMSDDEPKSRSLHKRSDSDDDALEKELNEELRSFEVVGGKGVDDKEIDALLDLK